MERELTTRRICADDRFWENIELIRATIQRDHPEYDGPRQGDLVPPKHREWELAAYREIFGGRSTVPSHLVSELHRQHDGRQRSAVKQQRDTEGSKERRRRLEEEYMHPSRNPELRKLVEEIGKKETAELVRQRDELQGRLDAARKRKRESCEQEATSGRQRPYPMMQQRSHQSHQTNYPVGFGSNLSSHQSKMLSAVPSTSRTSHHGSSHQPSHGSRLRSPGAEAKHNREVATNARVLLEYSRAKRRASVDEYGAQLAYSRPQGRVVGETSEADYNAFVSQQERSTYGYPQRGYLGNSAAGYQEYDPQMSNSGKDKSYPQHKIALTSLLKVKDIEHGK